MDVIRFVDVDQAELLEIDTISIIVVDQVINDTIVLQRHGNSTELKALNELLELNSAIEVVVEVPEGYSVVLELLLETDVHLAEQLLDVVPVHCILLLANANHRLSSSTLPSRSVLLLEDRFIDVLEMLKAFDFALVIQIRQVVVVILKDLLDGLGHGFAPAATVLLALARFGLGD